MLDGLGVVVFWVEVLYIVNPCREVPVDSFFYDSAGKTGRLTLICHCITATLCTGAMIKD